MQTINCKGEEEKIWTEEAEQRGEHEAKEEDLGENRNLSSKANYWKWYREDGRVKRTGEQIGKKEEEKREVWNRLKSEIIALK